MEEQQQRDQSPPLYETEFVVKGKVSVRFEKAIDSVEDINELNAVIQVTFDALGIPVPPARSTYTYRLPLSQIGPFPLVPTPLHSKAAAESRAILWASQSATAITQGLAVIANNVAALMIGTAAAWHRHKPIDRAAVARLIELISDNLRKITGLAGPPKPGPKPKATPLAVIIAAIRREAKKSPHKIEREAIAKELGISIATLERVIKTHRVKWRELKAHALNEDEKGKRQ